MAGKRTMSKDTGGPDATKTVREGTVVKLRLSMNKQDVHKLGRVTRWEKSSQDTSLELTGRD